jgi:hypothetical protein
MELSSLHSGAPAIFCLIACKESFEKSVVAHHFEKVSLKFARGDRMEIDSLCLSQLSFRFFLLLRTENHCPPQKVSPVLRAPLFSLMSRENG